MTRIPAGRFGRFDLAFAAACAVVTLTFFWGAKSGRPGLDAQARLAVALDLIHDLGTHYPHREALPDLDEVWRRYEPRLVEADRACAGADRPCVGYLRALRDLFAELRNGHTEVQIRGERGSPCVRLRRAGERVTITEVTPGCDADDQGLRRGDVVLEVDGEPVESALARVPAWRTAAASNRTRASAAIEAVLEGPARSSVRVVVETAERKHRDVRLRRHPIFFDWEDPGRDDEEAESDIEATPTRDGLAYLRISSFEGHRLGRRLDEVLEALGDAPGMILDLRSNRGGVVDRAMEVLSRFFGEPIVIGEHCVPGWPQPSAMRCTPHRLEPRGAPYPGVLAVLIDEDVWSAGELTAHALCGSGRGRCFGRSTAGETDCVFHRDVPGARVRMSWAHFRPAFGSALFGSGVQPNVPVERTLADVRSGRDADYLAARDWLLAELSPSPEALEGPFAAMSVGKADGPRGHPLREEVRFRD